MQWLITPHPYQLTRAVAFAGDPAVGIVCKINIHMKAKDDVRCWRLIDIPTPTQDNQPIRSSSLDARTWVLTLAASRCLRLLEAPNDELIVLRASTSEAGQGAEAD